MGTILPVNYQALYRKYRPQQFSQVVGQDHVTSTLLREVIEGKISHAYLFAGPRGTGKTTTARMLAKALNCTNRGKDGEPCNSCHSCAGITEGTSLDVIELDAASHNKVEDIREMRVNIGTVASVSGAKRVYILDEAHMLTRAAANALLKTLEEPPDHVHFVLATTEPYKLLDTVRSRSQRFDFHPVGVERLSAYLGELAKQEGLEASEDGLDAISRHARGSVRDALSLLEQVAALGKGKIDERGVAQALGLVVSETFDRLARAITNQDVKVGLEIVAEVAARGADLRRFVSDAIAYFRGIFLVHYAPNVEEIVDDSPDTIAAWRATARELPPASVVQAIDQLGEALLQLREGREERLVTELAIIRMTRQETATDPVSLAARLERLEERIRKNQPLSNPAPSVANAPVAESDDAQPVVSAGKASDLEVDAPAEASFDLNGGDEPQPANDHQGTPGQPAEMAVFDLRRAEEVWPAIIGRLRQDAGVRRHTIIREASPMRVEGNNLVLAIPSHLTFHLETLQADVELLAMVESAATELLGGGVRVSYEFALAEVTPVTETTVERAPDKHQLIDGGDGGVEAEDLVKDLLGGEVVDG